MSFKPEDLDVTFGKHNICVPTEDIRIFNARPTKFTLLMHDSKGQVIGKLFETDDGTLDYEGDLTDSAQVFFENVCKANLKYFKEINNNA